MIFSPPPQFGRCSVSISNTRLSSLAQLSRTGRWCAQFASHSAGAASWAAGAGAWGARSGWVGRAGSGAGVRGVVAGVGLRSIRERAEELGGRTEIVCPPAGGTLVRAWLPMSTVAEETP